MNEKEKQAVAFIESVRASCRIMGPTNLPLTGAENDSLREAVSALSALLARLDKEKTEASA